MKYFTNIHKNKTYNIIIRLGIIAATYYFIYQQIFHNRKLEHVVSSFLELVNQPYLYLILGWIVTLMVVNWSIEALKWQYLISKVEKISFIKAFEGVLSGISVSIFTPNRIGEWFGRVFILEKANPWKGVFITIIGSFSQLLVTIIVGIISLLFFIPIYLKNTAIYFGYWYYGVVIIAIILVAALLLIYLNVTALPGFVARFIKKRFVHILEYFNVISTFSPFELGTVLIFSFLRYCIFTLQFFLFLMLYSVELPFFQGIMIISMVFFIMTAIPTVTLAELGVRGSVSLYFIGLYFEKFNLLTDKINIGILSASSSLWLLNLAIPALLGTIFVSRLRFFRKRKNDG